MDFREVCTETWKMANLGLQNDYFPPVEDWDIRLSVSFTVKYLLTEISMCRHPPL